MIIERKTRMTKAGMLAAATIAAVLVSGCHKKAGGQVVAVVNGQEITQQELNGELNGAQIPPTADRKAIMNQLLARVIDRKLLVGKAERDKLDQSPAFLAQTARAHDEILINLLAGNVARTSALPNGAAADQFVAANPSLFGERKRYQLDQVAFPMTNDPALGKKLQAAKSMDAIVAALKESGVQYQSGKGQLDTGGIPPDAARKIAALPAGEPFLVPQGGQVVASVIRSSETVPVAGDQAKAGATAIIRRQAVETAMKKQLDTERRTAKIDYAQGFAAPPKAPVPAAQ